MQINISLRFSIFLPLVVLSCVRKINLSETITNWSYFQQYQIRCQLEDKALVLIHLVKKLKHVLCFASSVDTSHRLAILTGKLNRR